MTGSGPRLARPLRPLAAAAALVALTLPTLGLPSGGSGGSAVPAPADPSGRVRFDHARHADHLPDCGACHRPSAASTSPGAEVPVPGFERPREADCTGCHPFERPVAGPRTATGDPEVCALCHPVDDAGRVSLPVVAARPPALDFDHRRHERAAGAPCVACHDAARIVGGTPPPMETCLTCHGDALDGGCARCHLHDGRGRLTLDRPGRPRLFPPAWMGVLAHVDDFAANHAVPARSRRAVCESCHESAFCEGCHLGAAVERRLHPAGWVSAHGAASRGADLECSTCHRGQETCLSCHRRAGATLDSPQVGHEVPRGTSLHGETWALRPELHAREARRDLGSCVSCHAGRDCVTCHATVRPHGRGWRRNCAGVREAAPETCATCHAATPSCN
ncbi:MAG: hypothetical protein JXB32_11740 [Deltaproteobacteria bacterium]|nr:hypothetical protein [Deltaproteobacteria bacterium]